ncbi:MAG: NUDIX domain-containing protein [Alphaproteobacteria bacterium]
MAKAKDGKADRPKGPSIRAIPEGDDRERLICADCGFVSYENPKIVVGSVARWEEKILLCRRAIQPQHGFWTLPAGFMELNETAADGAAREAAEEANARIRIGPLLAVYNIPRIGQVQLIYIADLLSPEVSPGIESLEVGLFAWDDLPWDETAFPSVRWALDDYRAVRGKADFPPRTNPPGDLGRYTPGPPPERAGRKTP